MQLHATKPRMAADEALPLAGQCTSRASSVQGRAEPTQNPGSIWRPSACFTSKR